MAEKHSRKPRSLRGWRAAGIASYAIGLVVGASVLLFTPFPQWGPLSLVPFTALGSWLFWRGTSAPRARRRL